MNFVTYKGIQIPIDPPLKGASFVADKRPSDWVAGANSQKDYEVVRSDGDWRSLIFAPDKQYTSTFDTWECTDFGSCNSRKLQYRQKHGLLINISERAHGTLVGTKPNVGNYMYADSDWVRQENHGIILNDWWPNEDGMNSLADWFKPVPQSVIDKAIPVDEWYEWINDTGLAAIQYHLKHSPLNILITSGSTNHDVTAVYADSNGIWYMDSYPHNDPNNFLAITTQVPMAILKIVSKLMTNTFLGQINKKDGTKELFFGLPATSENALIDKALNTGYPLPTLNNGQNVDWPNVQPRFVVNE